MDVRAERLALRSPFRISRGEKTHAEVVVVELRDERGERALGEAVPYARYGESVDAVVAALAVVGGRARELDALTSFAQTLRGAAQNALTSALYARRHAARCARSLDGFDALAGAGTVVLDAPAAMADAARAQAARYLKLKLAGDGADLARLRAVRAACPDKPLWLDANEGLTPGALATFAPALSELGVLLLEQPFPASDEASVRQVADLPLPLCADEAFHRAEDAPRLAALGYRAVNVKLDKAGGVDRAIEAGLAAHEVGLDVIVGCMVCSELSIAAAWLTVRELRARGVPVPLFDLDGATFLARGRPLDDTGWGPRAAPARL